MYFNARNSYSFIHKTIYNNFDTTSPVKAKRVAATEDENIYQIIIAAAKYFATSSFILPEFLQLCTRSILDKNVMQKWEYFLQWQDGWSLQFGDREAETQWPQLILNCFKLIVSQALLDTTKNQTFLIDQIMRENQRLNGILLGNPPYCPIHLAAARDDLELVKMMVKYGASVDEIDNWGRLPLHNAAIRNCPPVVEFLLKAMQEKNISKTTDGNMETPYSIAKLRGYRECMKLLKEDSSYWKHEKPQSKRRWNDFVVPSLQELALRSMTKYIAKRPQECIEEYTGFFHETFVNYVSKQLKYAYKLNDPEWKIINALATSPQNRTLMNCTSIIKAAYIKFMHTRFCVKSGYFHLEKEDCVISVFEKRDMFQYVDITPSEKTLFKLFPTTRPTSGYSIVDLQQFNKNFVAFTHGALEGFDYSNCIVLGGTVSACLLHPPPNVNPEDYFTETYSTSDIDIYLYGLHSKEDITKKIMYIFNFLHGKYGASFGALKTPQTISFIGKYPKRIIQVIAKPFPNIPSILSHVDIDCTAVCFDGSRVWACPRAVVSYNYKLNYFNDISLCIRGSPQYESRLLKYSARGFSIVSSLPTLDITEDVGDILEYLWPNGRDQMPTQTGSNFLMLSFMFPEVYKTVLLSERKANLPYGPNVSLRDFQSISRSNYYDDSKYQLLFLEDNYEYCLNRMNEHLKELNDTDFVLSRLVTGGVDSWRRIFGSMSKVQLTNKV